MAEIREATAKDFDEIFKLLVQLQPDAKSRKPKVKKFFRELLSSGIHKAYVATEGGKIVGYMDAVFRAYHFSFEFTARIETTIVDKKHRRRGIASALLKKCEERAREIGCKRVEVDSAMHREEAHKFYADNGYVKRGYLFWKQV